MRRFISAFAAAGLLAGLASAQIVSARTGNWAWQAQLDMSGFKLADSGTECVTPEKAQLDLGKAVLGIHETCRISNWRPEGQVTNFSLVCRGQPAIDMQGELMINNREVTLSLDGNVSLGGAASPLPSSGTMKATRTGAC